MSYKLEYTRNGVTYLLTGADTTTGLTFRYLGDINFGLAPIRRITERSPSQDGSTDRGYRLDDRVVQVPFMVECSSLSALYTAREKVAEIFTPIYPNPLTVFYPSITGAQTYLRVTRPDATTRTLYVQPFGGLDFAADSRDFHLRAVVDLIANDPLWYGTSTTSTLATGTSTLTTGGDYFNFPIINLIGPLSAPIVIKVQFTSGSLTNEYNLTYNVGIASGDTVKIDLTPGFKTVTATGTSYPSGATNVIQNILAGSTLATFRLYPGANTMVHTKAGGAGSVQVIHTARYVGV